MTAVNTTWRSIRFGAVLAGIAAGLALLVPVGSVSAQPSSERTRIVVVDPVTAAGIAPGYQVVDTVHHSVCKRGVADISESLFTCWITQERSTGPCWAAPRPTGSGQASALCLRYPWGNKLIRVDVTRPLRPHAGTTTTNGPPWGLRFMGGMYCDVFGGAVGSFHGSPEFYACPHTRINALIPLDRTRALWTARTVRFGPNYSNPRKGRTREVSVAYFAESGN
jgi:hypothetical protein